jgi:hypothetical protein
MTWSRPTRADVALALVAVLPAWAALASRLEQEARPADAMAVGADGDAGPAHAGRTAMAGARTARHGRPC